MKMKFLVALRNRCKPDILVNTPSMNLVPEVEFQSIRFEKPIGKGTFGEVTKATWNGDPVAVKKFLRLENVNAYEREVLNLSRVAHPNIIKLYGVASDQGKNYLLMEYAENGCLHDFLHPRDRIANSYSMKQALSWALQCAEGVAYLHSCTPILLHRDLKPLNLLLTDDCRTLKICDFGEVVELRHTMTKDRGTPRWSAPEIYEGTHYNEKCDVFSWAIIFWELLTGEIPYGPKLRANDVIQAQIKGERPTVPENWHDDIKALITKCWNAQPADRLSMAEVVNEMKMIKNQ